MDDNIFYVVKTEKSKCSCCGKPIKDIYSYNGNDYGYYCFMEAIGSPVDRKNSKQKPLSTWVFELMNKYFYEEKDNYLYNSYCIYDDYVSNFFNENISKDYEDSPLWNRTTEIAGKKVAVYHQKMIAEYLEMRLRVYRIEKGISDLK